MGPDGRSLCQGHPGAGAALVSLLWASRPPQPALHKSRCGRPPLSAERVGRLLPTQRLTPRVAGNVPIAVEAKAGADNGVPCPLSLSPAPSASPPQWGPPHVVAWREGEQQARMAPLLLLLVAPSWPGVRGDQRGWDGASRAPRRGLQGAAWVGSGGVQWQRRRRTRVSRRGLGSDIGQRWWRRATA